MPGPVTFESEYVYFDGDLVTYQIGTVTATSDRTLAVSQEDRTLAVSDEDRTVTA